MGSFQVSCSIDFLDQSTYTRISIILLNVFGFFIPITIIVVCYSMIFVYFKKNSKNIISNKSNNKGRLSTGSSFKTSSDDSASQLPPLKTNKSKLTKSVSHNADMSKRSLESNQCNYYRRISLNTKVVIFSNPTKSFIKVSKDFQLAKNTLFIITGFCLSWLPYGILTIIGQFSNEREKFITPKSSLIPIIICKCSTILNPILHMNGNKEFTKKLRIFFLDIYNRITSYD